MMHLGVLYMQVEDGLQLRAILATAVKNGLMGITKQINGQNAWFFKNTEIKETDN